MKLHVNGGIRPGLVAAIALAVFFLTGTMAEAANSITTPDTGNGDVGWYASLALDESGNPVVSYRDNFYGDLKVLHCNDPDCAGSDESITAADIIGGIVGQTSLVLDGGGNPVVSYDVSLYDDLRLLHCNDPNCVGGDESITSPDTGGAVGRYSSLALDDSGNPVVSYYDVTNNDLKVMHCNDAYCTEGDESITSPDTGGDVGQYTSLALDSIGNPVVSYYDVTNKDLKVMHCNDVDCSGGNESITSPDTVGIVGPWTSLVLEPNDYPVVSYYDLGNGDLKVMHCNDVDCSGGNESITSPDTGGDVGQYTSLALRTDGCPVVSYYDATNGDLKVWRSVYFPPLGACLGFAPTSHDTTGDVGWYTSLVLDADANPVASYYDVTNGDLKVMRCSDPSCTGHNVTSPDVGTGDVGQWTSLVVDGSGNPVVSHFDVTNGDLKVVHCNDPNCAGGDESIASPDTVWDVGVYNSLVLDASGNPVVSYRSASLSDLKLMHCNDADCDGGDETITSPDTTGSVGWATSLALDDNYRPVISYVDQTNGFLKLMHCNDANCDGGDESITSPDTAGTTNQRTSLALDDSFNPVISYYDVTNGDLKVMHCNDADCDGGDETITSPDTVGDVGQFASLALDDNYRPVVSYFDVTNLNLKVMHCNDANCAGGDETITSPDTAGYVGRYTSLALDPSGNPIVSYYDSTNGNLKLLHCNDPNCTGGGESITSPDTPGDVGWYTSLALDSSGNSVVSYYDVTNGDLKVLHCDSLTCAPDLDGDGLGDDIDTAPGVFSDAFTDVPLGGTTFGQVLNREGLTVQVTKELNPTGVRLRASGTSPDAKAKIEVCASPATTYKLHAGMEAVVTCGSATAQVIFGPILAEFATLSANLPTGTTSTIAEAGLETFAVDNSSGSSASISVGGVSVLPAQIVTVQDSNGDGVVDVASWSGSACDTSNPSGDPDGDGLTNAQEASISTNPCVKDTESDGCTDGEEPAGAPAPKPGATGAYNPLAWYDFYDVPIPAAKDPNPGGAKNGAVDMADVIGVLFYSGATSGGPANGNGVDYDSIKGSCDVNGDTAPDTEGLCYDRTPSPPPSPPLDAGPPNGAVDMSDVLAVLAQSGLDCSGPP